MFLCKTVIQDKTMLLMWYTFVIYICDIHLYDGTELNISLNSPIVFYTNVLHCIYVKIFPVSEKHWDFWTPWPHSKKRVLQGPESIFICNKMHCVHPAFTVAKFTKQFAGELCVFCNILDPVFFLHTDIYTYIYSF